MIVDTFPPFPSPQAGRGQGEGIFGDEQPSSLPSPYAGRRDNKVVCLDYGERYVGVAITDNDGKIPLRHSVIDRKQVDIIPAILQLVTQEKVRLVLVGVPVSLSGGESAQTKISRDFITELQAMLGDQIKVDPVDERFTSKEAERRIKAEGGKPTDAHAEAARLMLADYML